jgi:hypothetical protein
MISCPYCGTQYQTFQPNCKNCGAPIPASSPDLFQTVLDAFVSSIEPPAPPREIVKSYIWKLFMTDGSGVTVMILMIIGFVFLMVGLGLIFGVMTIFVGIPFSLLGAAMFISGLKLGIRQYREKEMIVDVLKTGESVIGEITNLEENINVSINDRHPWLIEYDYVVGNRLYSGKVTTLNPPVMVLQPGKKMYVLYLPADPKKSSLYPHP